METTRKKSSATNTAHSDALLEEFFVTELKDIYWAEKHLVKALSKMEKAANSSKLKEAFMQHGQVTSNQVARLEQVFSMLGEEAVAKKCEAMNGLIDESQSIIDDTESGTATRDVGLILAAQKVEHYEIATYGGLAQLAKTLGRDEIANLLQQTLKEEKETDVLLSQIAEKDINYQAVEDRQ